MSDDYLRLIPEDPVYIPSKEDQIEAEKYMLSLGEWTESLSFQTQEEVIFVDQGSNFERLCCPYCKQELEIDWWQEAMDKASEDSFLNLEISLPCCGKECSINDLEYYWPAGFAQFIIEAFNPQAELSSENIKELERILNCKIRKIEAHY